MKSLEVMDELREQYSFEPVCRFAVHVFVRHLNQWDSDGYFLTLRQAQDHAREMRENHFITRIKACEQFSSSIVTEDL